LFGGKKLGILFYDNRYAFSFKDSGKQKSRGKYLNMRIGTFVGSCYVYTVFWVLLFLSGYFKVNSNPRAFSPKAYLPMERDLKERGGVGQN